MAQLNIKRNDATSVSTPPSGVQALFVGTDGIWYSKDSNGNILVVANGLTGPTGPSGPIGPTGSGGGALFVDTNDNILSALNATQSSSLYFDTIDGIAIGSTSNLTGAPYAIAIGSTASASGPYAIALGFNANATTNGAYQSNSIAIGKNAFVRSQEGTGAIAIGMGAYVNNVYRGIAIGESATDAAGNGSCIVGPLQSSASHNNILIGNSNTSGGSNVVGIGVANTVAAGSVGIGVVVVASGSKSVAVGYLTQATHTNAVSLGNEVVSVVADHTHVNALHIANVPVYADNSAATGAGLVAGQVYRTSTGVLMIVY